MNRKQRKIKKMIARYHTGHTAIVPIQKLLGKECLLRESYVKEGDPRKLAKIIGVTRTGSLVLVHCPYFESVNFGHGNPKEHIHESDLLIDDIEKYQQPRSCWWVSLYNVSVI